MEAKELLELRPALYRYLNKFKDCIKTKPSRKHFRTYISGQLSSLDRKSVEPIALEAGVPPRTLQEFLSLHAWDHKAVATRLRAIVQKKHASPNAIAVIDETGCPKKGDKTVGVQRQWCGATGKTDNCVVNVHLGYVAQNFHALIAGDLYLPKSWAEDQERRATAGVPEELEFRTKWQIALDLLDQSLEEGVEFCWLVADEEYGKVGEFRRQVSQRGLFYVVEVPKTVCCWLSKPKVLPERKRYKLKTKKARLAEGEPQATQISQLWADCAPPWNSFLVKESEKGPIVWQAWEQSVFLYDKGLPGEEVRLVIARQPLTGEIKYFLTNAPLDVELAEILSIAFSRWNIEQLFKEAKGEVGYDHFEVRKYKALQRHLVITQVSLYFLLERANKFGKKKSLVVSAASEACAGTTTSGSE